jgi:hypothetical protein
MYVQYIIQAFVVECCCDKKKEEVEKIIIVVVKTLKGKVILLRIPQKRVVTTKLTKIYQNF